MGRSFDRTAVSSAALALLNHTHGITFQKQNNKWVVTELPATFKRGSCYGTVCMGDVVQCIQQTRQMHESWVDKTEVFALDSRAAQPGQYPVLLTLSRVASAAV